MEESDKREHERFRINQLIGYYPNREEYLWAEGMNLSMGGLQCSSREALDPLTNVYVMLGVPTEGGEHLVRCEGYVAYSRMEGDHCLFGVKFEQISSEDRPFLEQYVESLNDRV